jgi:hypothetical protein
MEESRSSLWQRLAERWGAADRPWRGYGLAVVAVGVVSLIIAGLERLWPGGVTLSMLYLIAVLAVASLAGR